MGYLRRILTNARGGVLVLQKEATISESGLSIPAGACVDADEAA